MFKTARPLLSLGNDAEVYVASFKEREHRHDARTFHIGSSLGIVLFHLEVCTLVFL
jgi:hypothetical protein